MTFTPISEGDSATPAFMNARFNEIVGSGTEVFNVKHPDYAATGDGVTDDSSAIQSAINAASTAANGLVHLPGGNTFSAKNLTVPNNIKICIDGTLRMPANAAANDVLLKNSDQVAGNSGFRIFGQGILDGNADNQGWDQASTPTNAPQHIGSFVNCTDVYFGGGLTVTKNFIPSSSFFADSTDACLHFDSCTRGIVHDVKLIEWGREGIYFEDSVDSVIDNIWCDGVNANDLTANAFPYTSVAFREPTASASSRNRISNIYCVNAGASSVVLEGSHSQMVNCIAKDNRVGAHFKFGEASSRAATYCLGANLTAINSGAFVDGAGSDGVRVNAESKYITLQNIIAKDSGANQTTGAHYGISVVGTSQYVVINGAVIDNSDDNNINITDSSTSVIVDNVILLNAGGRGLRGFNANVHVGNVIAAGNANSNIQVDGSGATFEGFYETDAIVQPTTGIAEAAFVENAGGTAVNVDSTFGGYTLQQIAQALQNLGLLS